jgi:pilus assembly protein CpaE
MAKILVIDDNVDLLQMMRLILQERGKHEVILSADGADGLSRALSAPPDLAIVDVMMPGMTGYDIVRRMRDMPQTTEIPILILTARGQMIDRQTAIQAGANDHMAKPVTPQALLEKVDELLALHGVPSDGCLDCTVISVFSLRGGVGATTVAVNLALSAIKAQTQEARQVCLIDLSPASGQVTLHLRVRAQHSWTALPNISTTLSIEELRGLLTVHPSGLHVLAAPFEPPIATMLSAPLVEGTLIALKQHFKTIVIDAPPLIDAAGAAALDNSDRILLVLTPEVGAIQSTVAMLQVLNDMQTKVTVVLNHISPQPGVPAAAIEKALRRPPDLIIPFDPAQVAALPQGKPLAWAQPTAPLAVAVTQLYAMLQPR